MKTLRELYQEHEGKVSDKWSFYFAQYDRLLADYRNKPIRLLEIGIQNGGSLEIWSKFFPKAERLVGCDIDENCSRLRYDDSRIAVVVADANTDEALQQILERSPHFDIIIDDGSHRSGDIVRAFGRYFAYLDDGGLYIVEDLHCSYWREFDGGLFDPYSSMAFFKRLADVINHEHWETDKARREFLFNCEHRYGINFDEDQLSEIQSIEFSNSMCAIRKRGASANVLGVKFIAGTSEIVRPGCLFLHGMAISEFHQRHGGQLPEEVPVEARETQDRVVNGSEIAFGPEAGGALSRKRNLHTDAKSPARAAAMGTYLSPASFWMPEFLEQSAWIEHAPFAFWLTDAHRPRSFVELGTHGGFSFFAICQAATALGLDTRCYAIDTWKGDEHTGFYGEEVFERVQRYNEAHFGAMSRLVRSSFDDALAHFSDGSVDLLHIDGRHFYDDVKHDFEAWRRKLSERAVVLFHDTNVRERNFGVFRLWEELRTEFPSFEFLHGHGLGVLGYGKTIPDQVMALFRAGSDPLMAVEIRAVYGRLGVAVLREQEAQVPDVAARDAEIKQLTARLRAQEVQMASVTASLSARERDILALRKSTSWRITAPLRLVRGMHWRAISGFRQSSSKAARTIYRRVPLPPAVKIRIKESLFRWLAPVFRHTAAYRTWKVFHQYASARAKPRTKESGLPLRTAQIGNKRDPAVRVSAADVHSALFDQLFSVATSRGDEYVPLSKRGLGHGARIRAIAFYLPQFHPIIENDAWWGRGFTEWTNVSKAVPQFLGHCQPRQPDELGFYDLRIPEVQERQIELAKHYGLYGFCFHYYWFTGRKRLLERPLDQFLARKDWRFPFCVCWANENWTRQWDGLDKEILIEQRYAPEDDLQFIEDLAPVLKDPRYIRINDRPLIIVYRVSSLPEPRRTANVWREYCRAAGIGDPLLVAAQSFDIKDPGPCGFDAAVEFPPHQTAPREITRWQQFINAEFGGRVFSYEDLVRRRSSATIWPGYTLYRTVMPSWDNEARKPGRGDVFPDATPALYRDWFAAVCRETDKRYKNDDEKLVFVNAWNEWAEGAYLEPDRRFGYAYLEATKHVLARFPRRDQSSSPEAAIFDGGPAIRTSDTAVIVHLYYEDLWPEIAERLANLGGDFDLYVSLPDVAPAPDPKKILKTFPKARIARLPNRGRDIGPFIEIFRAIAPLSYSQVCKIHSKKSLHRGDGHLWRSQLLDGLVGSPALVANIKKIFRENAKIGMIGPANHYLSTRHFWANCKSRASVLARQLGNDDKLPDFRFFAGTMFWFRPDALTILLDHVTQSDFEQEAGQTDGTLAHALERLFPFVCKAAGFRVIAIEDMAGELLGDEESGALTNNTDMTYPFAAPSMAGSSEGSPVRDQDERQVERGLDR
jgi:lipopolysaccharide biosynthesis protein